MLWGSLENLPRALFIVLLLQLAMPLTALGVAFLFGWQGAPVVLALVLMSAAPSIVGSPNICLMMGVPPAFAMRLMVVGTVLLPLTVLPVFWLLPAIDDGQAVVWAACRLLAAVVLTTLVAQVVRRLVFPQPSARVLRDLEGASAIALSIFVIGLMPAVSAVAQHSPKQLLLWLAIVLAANFGAQLIVFKFTKKRMHRTHSVPISIIAGNRNIALFLVSLPSEVTLPVMAFIGCYQIPMYLTPIVMKPVYRAADPKGSGATKGT